MRKILFRGKDIAGNWHYGNLTVLSGVAFISDNMGFPKVVIAETVGQYTGLTDRNGTKIFEGDILFASKHNFTGVVEYNPIIASFMVRINDSTKEFYHYSHFNEDNPARKSQLEYTEVIGNIHDNPELLGV